MGSVNDVITHNGNEREEVLNLDEERYTDKEYQDRAIQRRAVSQKRARFVSVQGIELNNRMKEMYGYGRDEL